MLETENYFWKFPFFHQLKHSITRKFILLMKSKFECKLEFGEVFTALMREKKFNSDEQLARKAMRLQRDKRPRINVQRRTINNWRNNKSTPRSADDPQFKLVAEALNLSYSEVRSLQNLILPSQNSDQSTSSTFAKIYNAFSLSLQLRENWVQWAGSFVILAISSSVYFAFDGRLFGRDVALRAQIETEIPASSLRLSDEGFILPTSSDEVVITEQLANLTGWEIYVARNEIFARNGRQFVQLSSVCLQNHFDSWRLTPTNPKGWYSETDDAVRLTPLERDNARFIRDYECDVRGGQYTCNGQLNPCQ